MFKWSPACTDNTMVTTSRPSPSDFDAPRRRPDRRHPARTALLTLCASLVLYGVHLGVAVPEAGAASPMTATGSSFTFHGGGWGHGLGMSQYGAKGMAEAGRSHTQILTTYYQGATVGTRTMSDGLRVLVGSTRPTLTFTATGPTTFEGVGSVGAGAKVTLTRNANQIQVSGALNATVNAPLTVRMNGSSLALAETGNSYRFGHIVVRTDTTGLRAIVSGLTMQQYLYGLGEMPASWHAQALRAQVVAARTFAQKRRDSRAPQGLDYDLTSTVSDQVYSGTRHEHPNWQSAVDVTNGQVLTHGGTLIDAVYSSSNGGHSENSEYVWVASLPYLRGAPDPFEASSGNPHQSWSRTFTGAQLGSWFGLGTVTSVSILGPFGVSGRVDKATVRLTGTGGTKDMKGTEFRSKLNSQLGALSSQLMSTRFFVTASGTPAGGSGPKGNFHTALAQGRKVVVGGTASDPDGTPTVRVVSTMGSQVAVRDRKAVDGHFLVAWDGAPGTRKVCVSVLDVPTGAETSLGCKNVVVK